MKAAVSVENLAKKYSKLTETKKSYGVGSLLAEVFGISRPSVLEPDAFWAVHDLTFSVPAGSSFGLIGRNGCGKTTTLKLIGGLIRPDAGRIEVDGRVQALLSVGGGFNQTLSGWENIFNSAAILGLSARDTRGIVDRIVQFSELEEFIHRPVMTYSAGMKARLGFSLLSHLEPDVLLIDEVLAVGDLGFQNKCLMRLQELKKRGVTFILVSHNMTHIVQMCDQAVWLEKGQVMAIGAAKETVKAYLNFVQEWQAHLMRTVPQTSKLEPKESDDKTSTARNAAPEGRSTNGNGSPSLYHAIYDSRDHVDEIRVSFLVNNRETDIIRTHDAVVIRYGFTLRRYVEDLNVSLVFYRHDGLQLGCISTLNGDLLKHVHAGRVECRVRIPDLNLSTGHYVIVMPIHEGKSYLYRNAVKQFVVKGGGRLCWALMDFQYEYEVNS